MIDIKHIFERIEEINNSFRGISPRKIRREKQTFADALADAKKSEPADAGGKKAAGAVPLPKPSPLPLPGLSPASSQIPDFGDLIRKYSLLHDLDPKLVSRIIEVESGFDPKNVSRKGAMGLMQLMPETAKELGVENPFDPESNIAGGTRYFARLLDQNSGNLSLALAAYNAGPTKVREHGGVPPFPETRNFVSKVLESLGKKAD